MAPMETSQHISNDSFSRSWSKNAKPTSELAAESAAGVRSPLGTAPDGSGGRGSSSFIEVDPKLISMRRRTDSFEFGRPSSRPSVLVHADEIISNGLLLPLHLIAPVKSDIITSSSSSNSAAHPALTRSLSVDSFKPFLSRSSRFRSGRCPAPSKAASLESSPVVSPAQGFAASSCSSTSSKGLLVAGSCGTKKSPLLGGCAKSCKQLFRKYAFFLSPLMKKVNALASTTHRREDGCSAWCCTAAKGTSPTRRRRRRRSNAYTRNESWHGKVVDAGTEKAIQDAVLHCKNSFNK